MRRNPSTAQRSPAQLDRPARDAVRRFVRLLARSGCSSAAIEAEVVSVCGKIPRSWENRRNRDPRGDAAHVMTVWFSDPAFADVYGAPRALSLRGPDPSIESLIRRVDPKLDVQQVLRLLLSGKALRRVGARYVPRRRALIFPGADNMTLTLGGLYGLLETLEHNRWHGRRQGLRLQVYSFNPRVPVSAVGGFEKRLRPLAERLLVHADAGMHQSELARRKGERTVRMGLGVYQFVEAPVAARSSQPRRSHKLRVRKAPTR